MKYHIALTTICIIVCTQAQNGLDPNYFEPDIMNTKHDPYDLISSNFGQPAGQYNWNTDQFKLMNRAKRKCNGCTDGGRHVAIQNLTLFVNDEEYFITGVCYVPIPVGIKSVSKSGTGGGGFCSPRHLSDGTTKSACPRGSDTDFYDGGAVPGGPSGGWFKPIWERDFPIISAAGGNTLRMYYASPITRLYTQQVLNGTAKQISVSSLTGSIVTSLGFDHRPLFDTAYEYGLMIIWPLVGDQTLVSRSSDEVIESLIMNMIDEVGNHPALLMYSVGNEWDLTDSSLMAKVNRYISFARNYSMSKWGRSIPLTHALVDNPQTYNSLYTTLDVDVFSTNAGYRGLGFSDLWDGSQTPGFMGLGKLAAQTGKPNFVSEIGWMQTDGQETAVTINAGWFNLKWKDLIQKGTGAGCVGGAFFEYSDEVYTKTDVNQQTMGMVSPAVGGIVNGVNQSVPAEPKVSTRGLPTQFSPPSNNSGSSNGATVVEESQGTDTTVGAESQATVIVLSVALVGIFYNLC